MSDDKVKIFLAGDEIALAKGAAPETMPETAVFFAEQTAESLRAAIERFEQAPETITPEACRANAARCSRQAFAQAFRSAVETALQHHSKGALPGRADPHPGV